MERPIGSRQVLRNTRHHNYRNRTKNQREQIEGQKGDMINLREPEDGTADFFKSPTFHSGIRGISTKGLGTTPPFDILANLQRLYGKPSFQKLNATLLHLNKPTNKMQLVEVMLRGIEE